MSLDKQIHLYSIDTNFFYTEEERKIHDEIQKLQLENKLEVRKKYKDKLKEINEINKTLKQNEAYIRYKDMSNKLKELYSKRRELKEKILENNQKELFNECIENEMLIKIIYKLKQNQKLEVDKIKFHDIKKTEEYKKYNSNNTKIKELKQKLKDLLIKNTDIKREITSKMTPRDMISMFESNLSRTINIKAGEFTEDIMVIRVFYFEVFKSIVLNGFYYNNEKYVMWSASAGQIRQKKCVFIKEETLNKYYNSIYCGLTLDKINEPRTRIKDDVKIIEQGCNRNKYLAYTSLVATASDKWEDFDIDRAIVVEDFETTINELVDYIDYNDYDENGLWKITRQKMDITLPTMDGCGICLDYTGMVRLPWLKGLIIKFPFMNFITEQRKLEKELNPKTKTSIGKVKDIYGKEYDILKDQIKYIFTKSQFKMWKYYTDWDDYKNKFKLYGCEACKCNEEDDDFTFAKTSYQPLQSLYDLTDEEIITILKDTNNAIETVGNDRNKILKVVGSTKFNTKKNSYQEALMIYPELLNDKYSKRIIKETKASMINNARYGKIKIDGTYTFIIPDLYAFAEWLFLHIENPRGLLNKGEVSCNLFESDIELDMIRSPHLNFSHCVNVNVLNDNTKKWFKSSGIYVSIYSTDSLELMNDYDGDTSLVIKDKIIIEASKRIRNRHNIIPLYYKLKKAKDDIINNQTLYEGMISAYTSGNIGEVSNSITKIWNYGNIGINELRAISYLTLWNNAVIDVAKTLWLPEKSKEMENFLKQYTNKKLPHFFLYIKDKHKTENQLEVANDSVVNRLEKLVSNPRITFRAKNCGKLDYINLLHDKEIDINNDLAQEIIKKFKYINANKKFIKRDDVEDKNNYTNTFIKNELISICNNEVYITDVLVKYYYNEVISDNKRTLWDVFGNIILNNIKNNIDLNTKMCERCGERIDIINNRIKYCENCEKKIRQKKRVEYNKNYYFKNI